MKIIYLCLVSFLFSFNSHISKNLKKMNGSWKGQLTYRDYSSERKITIPANLDVRQQNDSTWHFEYIYPKEPHANTVDTLILSEHKKWNDYTIISTEKSNGKFQLITEGSRNDDGNKKWFRYTYSISKKQLTIQKEEKNSVDEQYFIRNSYQFFK